MKDLIDRQAVLDEINRIGVKAFETYNDYSKLFDFVDSLPSVSTEKLDKAKQEIRYGENKAYNADFTMGCEYAIGVIERMFEEVEE